MNSIAVNGGSVPRADASGFSQLTVRIASALTLAPAILAAIWFGAPWYPILIAAAVAIMAWEWVRMCCDGGTSPESLVSPFLALGPGIAAWFGYLWAGVAIAVVGSAAIAIFALVRRRALPFWAGAGVLLIGLTGIALIWLRGAAEAGAMATFWLFGAIWLTDSFAYFTGRAIGGPKLAPRISPNKTWAGLAGGIAASAAFSAAWPGWLLGQGTMRMALLGVGVAVIAQCSDLAVSRVKRLAHVKDTGTLIPGHGGLLDRVDGFLLPGVAIVFLALLGGRSMLPWQ